MKRSFILLLSLILICSFVSSEEWGYNYLEEPRIENLTININQTFINQTFINQTFINQTIIQSNASFNQTLTDNLYVNIDGDNMTGNLNIAANLTLSNGEQTVLLDGSTGSLDLGLAGFETGSINIDGTTYSSKLKVNDFGIVNLAQTILHRHSNNAIVGSVLVFARSRGNNKTHDIVQTGDDIGILLATAWTGSHYDLIGDIIFEVGTGTINASSSPGRLIFKTTPDETETPIERMRIESNGNINISNNITVFDSIKQNGYFIKSKPSNQFINGETFTLNSNATTPNPIPFVGFQQGGPGQASWIGGSLMGVNRNETILITDNASSCIEQANSHGIDLLIDCNSSSPTNPFGTGPDLLWFGDSQFAGTIKLRDTDLEWHDIPRELDITDQMNSNVTLSGINGSLVGSLLTIQTIDNKSIIVNIDGANSDLDKNNDSISLTLGTNETPILNQVFYTNQASPTLATSTIFLETVPRVGGFLMGGGKDYGSFIGGTTIQNYIQGSYNRALDEGIVYKSGFDIGSNSTIVNISTGTVKILFQSFDILQNHSTNNFYEIHSDGSFHIHLNNFSGVDEYATGEAVGNNRYFNVVCGIVTTFEGNGNLLCIPQDKPDSEHINTDQAENDNTYVNFFPSHAVIKLIYTPVFRVVVQRSGGVNEIQTLSNGVNHLDLRGQISGGGSPPTPGVTALSQLNIDTNLDMGGFNATATFFIGDGSLLKGISSNVWNVSGSNIFPADLSNSVGIGTDTPGEKFDVVGTIATRNSDSTIKGILQASVGGQINIGSFTDHPVTFITNDSTKMTLDTDGRLGIGESSPTARLEVKASSQSYGDGFDLVDDNTNYRFQVVPFGSTEIRLRYGNNGGTGGISLNTDATAWSGVSDLSLKEDIISVPSALDKINNIRGVNFNWKNKSWSKRVQVGVIAQEVEQYIPEIVNDNGEGLKTVQYSMFAPYFIEAIQELSEENDLMKQTLCNMNQIEWC